MKDLISIIVPVYNVEKFVNKCFDSIINQTYKNIEIIVVDDGSTDNSASICDRYAEKDNRVKVFHKANGGLISAWTYGLNKANGKYVGFVDSDDHIELDMFESLFNAITKDDSDLSICNVFVEKDGESTTVEQGFLQGCLYEGEMLEELKSRLFPSDKSNGDVLRFYRVNKLFVKSKLDKVIKYLNKDVTLYEDLITTFPYILTCEKISVINKPYYYYVNRSSSIVHTNQVEKSFNSVILATNIAKEEANDLGEKYNFNFDYFLDNNIVLLIKYIPSYKIFKQNYKYLNDARIKEGIKLSNPHFTNKFKIKAFLLKHKLYFCLYMLLKLKNRT